MVSKCSPFLLWYLSPVHSLSLALVWRAWLSRLTLKIQRRFFLCYSEVGRADYCATVGKHFLLTPVGVIAHRCLYVLQCSGMTKDDSLVKEMASWNMLLSKCEFRCTQGEPSVHFGKIQVHFKKIGEGSGKAKLEEPVSHTHFRVSFLKG